jgi:replication factor C large subunit
VQKSETVAWTEKYRPTATAMLLGNEEAVEAYKAWMKQWTLSKTPTKACLLVGPPGVGKTTLARAAANDFHFRVVEMNASDIRTEKAIKTLLAPARSSTTLDSFSAGIHGNLILMDEVDGVFGREDRGGLGAILTLIKRSPVPIVLTANNVDPERFDDLKKACILIQLVEIRPKLLLMLINHILTKEGRNVPSQARKQVAQESHGDIRSAINDIQAMATSGAVIGSAERTKELDAKGTLMGLFASRGMQTARRALNETEIPLYRDELLLLIHDLLPYLYTTPNKLASAYDSLSRADIGYGRVGASRSRSMMPPPFNLPRRDAVPEWSLLPVALNELATVGTEPVDNDVAHVMDVAQRVSVKVADRYQYRLWALEHLCGRIAGICHASKRKARHEIVPFIVAIFRIDQEIGQKIAQDMGAEERDIDFLISESKTQVAMSGPGEVLDPSGFKLPYMGKDKFIQLMRAGVSYDRSGGKFALRHLGNLDSVEERVSEIIGKPIKFLRPDQTASEATEEILKECFVDGRKVRCDTCEFVENCPTHIISSLKFCLCDETLSDPEGYEKYVAKNSQVIPPLKPAKPRRTAKAAKRPVARKKS